MIGGMRRIIVLIVCIAGYAHADRMLPDELRPPTPELVRAASPVALPRPPVFELAPLHAGYHTPLELRRRGDELLGHELVVRGFVTGIYDCIADLSARFPGASRDALLERIDRDLSICQRPKFYLGQSETMPLSLSITVVDVPRPPTRREAKDMTEADYLRWPKVPKLGLHDYLGVTGRWAVVSPHGERDAHGLLVYRSLVHEAITAEARAANTPLAAAEPEIAVDTRVPLRRVIGNEHWNASIDHLNACTHAVSAQRFTAAIPECEAATAAWPDNHLAWYGIASAQLARGAWSDAIAPARRAVELRPDVAMYQMYYGIALYQAGHADPEHHALPAWLHLPSFEADRLDLARDALRRAVKLMPGLWRARYYLARAELEHGEAAMAADQLQHSITLNPDHAPSYLALADLYLRWGYRAQARAVAQAGVHRVRDAQLWYELATIDEADRALPAAIDDYTQVLASEPGNLKARFARGRLRFDLGQRDAARGDLERVAATTEPALALERQLANQLLWAIREPGARPEASQVRSSSRPGVEQYR
jgi:tetratricopeptide (TPR) repeat protein